MSDYSEVSQLRTQCTILESQLEVLRKRNAELTQRIEELEKQSIPLYKEVAKVGRFPIDPDDGFHL